MNEIICPNCQKVFKVDEAGFADILKQVRDHKFEEELRTRLNLAEKDKETAVKLTEANKDKEIMQLKAKLQNAEVEKKLSVTEAVQKIEKERDNLASSLK
ncbi:MAG: hypothetical protein ACRDEB_03690, partial [Chitinophagaceae bacterium]